jgi:hypothetical protein
MPARYKDYPIYVYDEPAEYKDFTGGVNTHPNSETLKDNELQSCINMTYDDKILCKRKGLNIESSFSCDEDLHTIQGIFLLPLKVTYIIVAADGKLFYGLYQKGNITLQRLHIKLPILDTTVLFNPKDTSAGLELSYYLWEDTVHDGYIYATPNSIETSLDAAEIIALETALADVSIYYERNDDELKTINIFDANAFKYYTVNNILYKFTFPKFYTAWDLKSSAITPLNTVYWEELNTCTGTSVVWDYTLLHYYPNQIVQYKTKFYKCIKYHRVYESFYQSATLEPVSSSRELIFQNKDKIEGTTFQNVLYIATGTRFVQVSQVDYDLKASIVDPHICNNSEIQYIGYNYLSPYPELCRATQHNSASTAIGAVLVQKLNTGMFKLTPMMSFRQDADTTHFSYRWEKCVNGVWYVVVSYKDNISNAPGYYYEIIVPDADKYLYRVTYADLFALPATLAVTDLETIPDWESFNNSHKFLVGDWIKHNDNLYQCVNDHIKSDSKAIEETISTMRSITIDSQSKDYWASGVVWENTASFMTATPHYTETTIGEDGYPHDTEYKSRILWEPLMQLEAITRIYPGGATEGEWDLIVEESIATSSRASTILFNNNLGIESTFLTIHSCKKILTDGNKLLLYDDAYNTGCWFKTILNNPGYITDKGSLSFKTTKNERLVKVIPYNTVLIAFANSEGLGGSIHMVQGSGDDYDDGNYYSPYQRATMNTEVSCDNADTVQICEGLLVFKYYDTVYYIMPSSSELQNESLFVYSANDKLKMTNNALLETLGCPIPWEDNSCVSEITDEYYGLIWSASYAYDGKDIYCIRPTIRVKMYYKMLVEDVNKYTMPWLIDNLGNKNISYTFSIENKPKYLIDNNLYTQKDYTDNGDIFSCKAYLKNVDLNYPKQVKFLNSVVLCTQRDQEKHVEVNIKIKNDAGYVLLNSSKKTLQQLRSAHSGANFCKPMKIGKTNLNATVYNMQYRFPCLNAGALITSDTEGWFSLSSVLFTYTSAETPDSTPFDNYTKILRKGDVTI